MKRYEREALAVASILYPKEDVPSLHCFIESQAYVRGYTDGYTKARSEAVSKVQRLCFEAYELMIDQGGNLNSFARYIQRELRWMGEQGHDPASPSGKSGSVEDGESF